ncbi:hypothetical protein D9M70_580980 [compost metagenome]
MVEVDALQARLAGDGLGRFRGDDADPGLGSGESDLDVDIALDQGYIGENPAHPGGAEGIAEQDRVNHGAGRGGGEQGHVATLRARG